MNENKNQDDTKTEGVFENNPFDDFISDSKTPKKQMDFEPFKRSKSTPETEYNEIEHIFVKLSIECQDNSII